ncbi:hypothetical protein EMCRGX_G009373 [Ephydatia muelleri]
MEEEEDRRLHTQDFEFEYKSKGNLYQLSVPVQIPYEKDKRELVQRLMKLHLIPSYEEDSLFNKISRFIVDASVKEGDRQADEWLSNSSKDEAEMDKATVAWAQRFGDHHSEFSAAEEGNKAEVTFSDVYHKLIHSPALETLFQLEHTYSMAMEELCESLQSAKQAMKERHQMELNEAMQGLEVTTDDQDINVMMRRHAQERESCDQMCADELRQLQNTQRMEYREWVCKVHEDLVKKSSERSMFIPDRKQRGESFRTLVGTDPPTDATPSKAPPLEESFTISLGAQMKWTHNMRVMRGDLMDLFRLRAGRSPRGIVTPDPHRMEVAMSLYSSKLVGVVMMVDETGTSSYMTQSEEFVKVCLQSTDFHFPDVNTQLDDIQGLAAIAAGQRRTQKASLTTSTNSQGLNDSGDGLGTGSSTSPVPIGRSVSTNSSSPSNIGNYGGTLPLQSGDIYMTRHSNLSAAHVVFHLVSDEKSLISGSLQSRHPILLGLKNCLRVAAKHGIYNVTIPLLLVHSMLPEMTISWCTKRAELVLKCVKGFMLENSLWADSESRTVQFLVPSDISRELFDEFCDLLPKIFRVATVRTLS